MRLKHRRGLYITNSRLNNLLYCLPPNILDAFEFQNPKEISDERFKEYMKEVKR